MAQDRDFTCHSSRSARSKPARGHDGPYPLPIRVCQAGLAAVTGTIVRESVRGRQAMGEGKKPHGRPIKRRSSLCPITSRNVIKSAGGAEERGGRLIM